MWRGALAVVGPNWDSILPPATYYETRRRPSKESEQIPLFTIVLESLVVILLFVVQFATSGFAMSLPLEPPSDLVAAFHTSFHFTQGNTLDWSSSIDESAFKEVLDGVEFSSLPSGLHTVESDVVCVPRHRG